MNRAQLKADAKSSLKGKYGQIIIMYLIYFVITFAIGLVMGFIMELLGFDMTETNVAVVNNTLKVTFGGTAEMVQSILSFVVTAIFSLGIVSFYLKVSRNEEVTYKELFSKKSLWLLFIGVSIMTSIFTFLWTLLLIIPGIIAAYKYSMVNYIMVDNPELGVMGAIRKSKEIMQGHKMDLFVLQLSFLGWALLGVLTFGILYIWLVPYMSVTTANFYNQIKGN